MQGVLLEEDLARCGELVAGRGLFRPLRLQEPSVAIDSRAIVPGGIFIALCGTRTDGHQFVGEAFERGALVVMVERSWFRDAGSPEPPSPAAFLVVEDAVLGLQQLASLYRATFSIPVVAVGGSNGKTTTKEMVAAVLSRGFAVHSSAGNFNNHIGVPLTLFGIRRKHQIAVVEMGINHPGEMEELAAIAGPTHGLLTNIGSEHLEFLGDLEGVARAETRLYAHLDRSGGTLFVNLDDQRLRTSAGTGDRRVGYASSPANGAFCHAEGVCVGADGRVSFLLAAPEGRLEVRLALTGRHNVINAVAAAAIGFHFGLSLQQVKEGLEGLSPKPGWKRLELLEAGGVRIINDTYNANPDSMRLAIETLCDMPASGRRIAVLGDMLELGEAGPPEHEAIGRFLEGLPVASLLTFGTLAASICRACPGRCIGHFSDPVALCRALEGVVEEGDVVLFKASRGMRLELAAESLAASRTINQA